MTPPCQRKVRIGGGMCVHSRFFRGSHDFVAFDCERVSVKKKSELDGESRQNCRKEIK